MKKKNISLFIIAIIIIIMIILVSYINLNSNVEVRNYRIEKYNDQDYYIIENDYKGEYDLQIFSLNQYIDDPNFNKNIFEKKVVMNYDEYESYCDQWKIKQKYTDNSKKYIVFSYLSYNIPILEVRLSDINYMDNDVELYIWDNTGGYTMDISAYSLIIPVEKEFDNVNIIPLITNTEFENIKQYGTLDDPSMIVDKPIIYLYPKEETKISIKLLNSKYITCSYPKYIDGWDVLAHPNGDLVDLSTGRNLYSLYYESKSVEEFNVTDEGFVVKGEDSIKFLEEKLEILGLNEIEAEEFIIYWLPKLESNKYNYIRFATMGEIDNNMPIKINPRPDTVIRVLMTFKGLENPIYVEEQKLVTPIRKGFTVVEWGGTEIK